MSGLKRLIHEVHRRSLWQVLGIYLLGSWIALQVVDVLANNFGRRRRRAADPLRADPRFADLMLRAGLE